MLWWKDFSCIVFLLFTSSKDSLDLLFRGASLESWIEYVLFMAFDFTSLRCLATCVACSISLFYFLMYCRWHAVASWTWDAQDETCGICRMAFDGCCPDCKLPGDDCPLSKQIYLYITAKLWDENYRFCIGLNLLCVLCVSFCLYTNVYSHLWNIML